MRAMVNTICGAISEMRLVQFSYQGSMRVVEPHTVGTDQKGHLALCGWQLSGGSAVSWRNYHLDEMSALRTLDETFDGPREGYNRADKRFATVSCQL